MDELINLLNNIIIILIDNFLLNDFLFKNNYIFFYFGFILIFIGNNCTDPINKLLREHMAYEKNKVYYLTKIFVFYFFF